MLLFLLFLFLQVPSVQRYIANTVADSIVKKSNGSLSFEKVNFDIYDGVQLDNALLIDAHQDTLVSVKRLQISPTNTMLSLINKLSVSDLSISGVEVDIHRKANEATSNWGRFLREMSKKSGDEPSGEPLSVWLSHLMLEDVYLDYRDEVIGAAIKGSLKGLNLHIDHLDSTLIDIDKLIIIEPSVEYTRWETERAVSSSTSSDAESQSPPPIIPLNLNTLSIVNGYAKMINGDKSEILQDVGLLAKDVEIETLEEWIASINDLSFRKGDFVLKHFSANEVSKDGDQINAPRVFYRLDRSFGDMAVQIKGVGPRYDLSNAEYDIKVKDFKLNPNEVSPLSPQVRKLLESINLKKDDIQLSGDFVVSKNKISINQSDIWVNGDHYIKADGQIYLDRDTRIDLKVDKLITNAESLDALLIKTALPEEVKRLGNIDFKGNFNGTLSDFQAAGTLLSDLGEMRTDVDIHLNRYEGDSLTYAGLVAFQDFDIATLTGDDSFGPLTAQFNIERGAGLDFASSNATLGAQIPRLEYRDYIYEGAQFEGELSSQVVNGHFEIRDTSIDFEFAGVVDLSRAEPIFDFVINAEKINLCELNLANAPCEVSFDSDINFKGDNVRNLEGYALLTDVEITQDGRKLQINRLGTTSRRGRGDEMIVNMNSDYVDAELKGEFNLLELSKIVIQQLYENHADHYEIISKKVPQDTLLAQNFNYKITVKEESTELFDFLKVPLSVADNTKLTGEIAQANNRMSLHLNSPNVQYKNWSADQVALHFTSKNQNGSIDIRLDSVGDGSRAAEHLYFNTNIQGDKMIWVLNSEIDKSNHIELEARSTVQEDGYFTEFLYDDILVDSSLWTILPNKGVGVYPKKIDIASFVATDGRRSIGLKDIANKGIEVSLKEFNIEFLNPIINYDKLYFTGNADVQGRIDNIYQFSGITGIADIPDLHINGDPFGNLVLNAKRSSENLIALDMSIEKDTQQLYLVGSYNVEESSINTDITIENYPMNFFEYIIDEGISETSGLIDVKANINGFVTDMNSMKLDANAYVRDAGVRIDYIGAYYRIAEANVPISETLIDFTGVELIDELDNTALMDGGLVHEFFVDIAADCIIRSPRFIALNTTKEDNPTYYGTGVGPIEASFKGLFSELDMDVTATAGRLSTLYIPILTTQGGYDESFIKFDYEEKIDSSTRLDALAERLKASGVDFEMNLTFDTEAEVQIIYDEATSNILIGHGTGDLRVAVKRDGEFTIFGDYNVDNGKYLFTTFNFIAKPFIIEQGGTVTWTGDPINANLNIKARHLGLRAPLDVLLAEYVDAAVVDASEFSQRRNVDLTLELTENLFSPTINFDISFPDLNGQIRSIAESKIQTLKSTENGINNQVIGLLVFGNFLPDNNPFANISGGEIAAVGNNTITEFLTSQLSLLASEYLSSRLSGGIISGIDLELALNQNQYFFENNPDVNGIGLVPDEVNLNLRNRFKNDNFVLNIGGNYVRENNLRNLNNYLTGNFSFDWYITDDRRLKLRLYAIYDYDETNVARRQKYGFGINFRHEFGTLSNETLTGALDEIADDINEGATQN